ncbi:uncharacterized protein TM35_000101840 [Trypanosoma theileri]|uniref:Uncharacterized protein n=1 Tax=Trypanosoma theileri TaxID=67003 RepID=A0A1X0NYX8_9TRYP|nr:uncharacterized protein TM35_000101840 [Trypanosoma theileri]ORC89916.1 hypothetical protein TM35_000101840 [Trypanosoma theileri]
MMKPHNGNEKKKILCVFPRRTSGKSVPRTVPRGFKKEPNKKKITNKKTFERNGGSHFTLALRSFGNRARGIKNVFAVFALNQHRKGIGKNLPLCLKLYKYSMFLPEKQKMIFIKYIPSLPEVKLHRHR